MDSSSLIWFNLSLALHQETSSPPSSLYVCWTLSFISSPKNPLLSDASSNEAVHLQQRLKSLSTELVTLRNRLHVGQVGGNGSAGGVVGNGPAAAVLGAPAPTATTTNNNNSNNNNNLGTAPRNAQASASQMIICPNSAEFANNKVSERKEYHAIQFTHPVTTSPFPIHIDLYSFTVHRPLWAATATTPQIAITVLSLCNNHLLPPLGQRQCLQRWPATINHRPSATI